MHVTVSDASLFHTDRLADGLAGMVWFSVLNSWAAYWIITTERKDRPKT